MRQVSLCVFDGGSVFISLQMERFDEEFREDHVEDISEIVDDEPCNPYAQLVGVVLVASQEGINTLFEDQEVNQLVESHSHQQDLIDDCLNWCGGSLMELGTGIGKEGSGSTYKR